LFGDGVVTDTSALLNGVTSVAFPGLTHSPAVAMLGPSMTENAGVFEQIETWLTSDIPKGRFVNMDMRIYLYDGEAYKQNPNIGPDDGDWLAISATDDLSVDEYESLMTKNGKMTILLKSGMNVFGTVDLAENTEMYFEYASPHMMRVSISRGSAKFTTDYDSDYHFETKIETTLEASKNIQIVRGYLTEYVITMGEKVEVYCVDGSLEVLNASDIDDINTALLKTGQGAELLPSGGFDQVSIPVDKWWDDEFYNKETFDYYLNAYRLYIYGGVAFFILFILVVLRGRRRRRRRKHRRK